MAKTKPDVKVRAKKSVSTNAIFKKAGKEALRQEQIGQRKYAIEKSAMAARNSKEQKAKHRSKQVTEHPLAEAFSDTIKHSREVIQAKVIADVASAYDGLTQRLIESNELFEQADRDAAKVQEALVKPLKELVLEWTSTDGKHSGKAILGHRMKKFQKTVETEEKEIERQYEEWTGVQAEIRRLALEVIGPDGLEGVLAGNIESSTFIDEEQEEMREEIEAEKKRFKEQIEQAGKASMKAMKDGEKQLTLKQKEIEESFLAILRDDEY